MLPAQSAATIAVVAVPTVSPEERSFQSMLAAFGGRPHAELGIVLAALKAVAGIHQTNHWQARGDAFFGDHLLFERIYGNVAAEIDRVAERAVGLSDGTLVDLTTQTKMQFALQKFFGCKEKALLTSEALVSLSLGAEMKLLALVGIAEKYMSANMTRGTDNLLASVQDVHEGHVYLLKQRLG